MRRAARVDDNQKMIVEQLRRLHCSVKVVSQLKGFCDIVVGHRGVNYLFEIKDPSKPPSKRKLTKMEKEFHEDWYGQVSTIETIEDAMKVMGIKTSLLG